MKIGILTLPPSTNYGGILQAYALQTILERRGHNVCLIEKQRKYSLPLWKMPLSYGKRMLKNLLGDTFPVLYEQKMKREIPIIRQNTDIFINKYIKRRIVENLSDISEDDFDAIIVGSDQIWRPKYLYYPIAHAYLDFTKGWNIIRIAYAASFGTDKWEYTYRQTKRCSCLLKKFDAVSVREKSGIDLCREYFDVESVHVLDPTMLLPIEDYINLFKVINTLESKGSLLYCILDETPEKFALINKIAEEKHLKPFSVNSRVENLSAPLDERIQPPVEQWLRGFYDAEFVITDSFHACVFSILFNKPFIVIGNEKRGMSRFISLLEMFGLENRLLIDTFENNSFNEINWQKVNVILNDKRMDSSKIFNKL